MTWMNIKIAMVVLGMVAAGVIWLAFLRPVPKVETVGTISGRTLVSARTVTRTNTNAGRSEYHSESVGVPQGFEFTVDLSDGGGPGVYYLQEQFGEAYKVGQKVKVTYQVRGLPPFWTRTFILDMSPAGS